MPFSLDNLLVIGISSRALFDLETEEAIFRNQGLDAYRQHQLDNENNNFSINIDTKEIRRGAIKSPR